MAERGARLAQKVEVRCERCDQPFETTVEGLVERSRQWCDRCLESGGHLVAYRLVYRAQRTVDLLVHLEGFRREASDCRELLNQGHGLSDIAEQTHTSARYVAHLLVMEEGLKGRTQSKE